MTRKYKSNDVTKTRTGDYGQELSHYIDTFTYNVQKTALSIPVPTNRAVVIIVEYMIEVYYNNEVKMQTGYLQLLARNQNGTVSSVLNEIGSFKKEFSVSDITTSIVTDVTGTNANLKFTITTAFGDVASTNYIFFSARTMGDKAIYIPAP